MAAKRHKEAQKLSMKISSQLTNALGYCSAERRQMRFPLRASRLCGLIGAPKILAACEQVWLLQRKAGAEDRKQLPQKARRRAERGRGGILTGVAKKSGNLSRFAFF
jgi:hypothetical protein